LRSISLVQKKPDGVQYCCVCQNWRGKIVDGKKVSLHRFPADENVLKVWIKRVKLSMVSDFVLNKYSRLCSHHFLGQAGPKKPDITIPSLFPKKSYQTTRVSNVINSSNQSNVSKLSVHSCTNLVAVYT
jgi:hypothetical protein